VFCNYLFYLKETRLLSIQTLKAAGASVAITLVLVFYFGLIGGAVAFGLSYALYLLWVIKACTRVEPAIRGTLAPDLRTMTFGTTALVSSGLLTWLLCR
jgi:O-antigen/teichoic acid export membrane protein